MAQLLLRDLTVETVKRLKMRAKLHHRSLQGELKHIVESATRLSAKEAVRLGKSWHKRLGKHAFSDSADLLREDRSR